MNAVKGWEARGRRARVLGREIFFVDEPPVTDTGLDPVLVLHGFPTCSFDWRAVWPSLRERRRVIAPDMLGYGLSDKPLDHHYSLVEQADIVSALLEELRVERCALVTHDIGDSVGGELLARALDGALPFEITRRVITNVTIYMDLVQLSAGQQLMLALPDEALPEEHAPNEELFTASLAATFARPVGDDEMRAQWELVSRAGGNRILPRLIRYIDERRALEPRWTGAIEVHPSPLAIVWCVRDPIAVPAMAERIAARRPDVPPVLLDAGHYPMIELPDETAAAISAGLEE